MFQLRDYQTDIIHQARELIKSGVKSILIQSPCGSGKTALTAHMIGAAASKGIPSFFIVHRRELLYQSAKTFDEVGIQHGFIASGFPADPRPLVQIASIQSLARRLDKVKTPKLIVWDECHRIACKSWSAVHAHYPDAIHIGLTATPCRLDGKGLGDWFATLIRGPTVSALITQGYLSPYKAYAPTTISTEGLHTKMGDYVTNEIVKLVDKPTITGDVIAHYKRLAPGKRALIFCASIKHSAHVVEQFNLAGIPAEHVDGEADKSTRDAAMKRFQEGKTLIISNVELFGEGLDIPSIEAVILLRMTQSLGLALQQIGRVLRPGIGKTAIILDHVGNLQRHGLPDEDRKWSLSGREHNKSGKSQDAPVRTCPKCFAVMKAAMVRCKYCGHIFEVESREVLEREGELVEVDKELLRRERMREQGRVNGFEELVALGKQRGYKHAYMWARNVMQARQAKQARRRQG
ncbi:MAG: hypothetical protein A2W23_06430 [Planctomycetes bacterium RBG_16_43_13]|nr:MAG: hypothetical protein A2W23_06430 [Planctomycetes bacterium RBG_16_43_13]